MIEDSSYEFLPYVRWYISFIEKAEFFDLFEKKVLEYNYPNENFFYQFFEIELCSFLGVILNPPIQNSADFFLYLLKG